MQSGAEPALQPGLVPLIREYTVCLHFLIYRGYKGNRAWAVPVLVRLPMLLTRIFPITLTANPYY